MNKQQINSITAKVLMTLSAIALITVLTGYFQAPQADEGTAAHIFQLAVVAVLPVSLVFFATADWNDFRRSARPLFVTGIALVIAFCALYYLENVWYVRH
jgi:hypothetical protein